MEPRTEAQHVVPHEEKWAVRAEHSKKPSKLFDSKLRATAYAFDIADHHKGRVVIHNKDGTIKDVKVTDETSKFITALTA